jgi:N6-L-threonylcarbamoyladenine synthase
VHERFGGVVPSLAAREHEQNIGHVFDQALHDAHCTLHDIDLVAVTRGPGLGPALLVGLMFARTLAWQWNKPLVGVNHLDGHIHSNWLSRPEETRNEKRETNIHFPALNLIVSGGHTELVLMHGHGDYEIIGETRDDAVGEAFDKVARLLELGYPGGPRISALAKNGNSAAYPLPRPMLASKDLNFSYSGLKTAALYLIRDLGGTLTEQQKADIAASFQEAAIDVLLKKTRLAAISYKPQALLLSGGVSANALLRSRLTALGSELETPVFIPDLAYTGDNAAMIAVAGYFAHQKEKAPATWRGVTMDANLRLGHNSST